jgi:hypothetical protein
MSTNNHGKNHIKKNLHVNFNKILLNPKKHYNNFFYGLSEDNSLIKPLSYYPHNVKIQNSMT